MFKKLCDILKEVDAVLVTSPHNLRYFTGFRGGEGVALIGNDFRFLFVDSRYTEAARGEAIDFDIIEFGGGKLLDTMYDKISVTSVKSVGFENNYMSVSEHEKYIDKLTDCTLVGLKNRLDMLRIIKTDKELGYIKRAAEIANITFKNILAKIKCGVSECEVAAEIEYTMRRLGGEGTSFETIVVSGVKSSMPHGMPGEKKLEYGDFVTMDFGCVYNGYCSDMTRTVVMGEANQKQVDVYNTVLKAQMAGLEYIKSGKAAKDADKAARDVITDACYGEFFGHSLGHGVGLLIHELPNLSPLSETILEENMVVTCEPGIYIPAFGGVRIEDLVVVKKDGILNLTSSPKELIVCG